MSWQSRQEALGVLLGWDPSAGSRLLKIVWRRNLLREPLRGARGEREQIAVLLLGWVFFIPFTTTLQVHGFIWLLVFPAYQKRAFSCHPAR